MTGAQPFPACATWRVDSGTRPAGRQRGKEIEGEREGEQLSYVFNAGYCIAVSSSQCKAQPIKRRGASQTPI